MKIISLYKKNIIEKIPVLERNEKTFIVSKTAFVDETNDPGSRTHGTKYIIGATVIDKTQVDQYGKITEKRFKNKKREQKFRKTGDHLREEILEEISKLNPHIIVVTIRKPRFKKWTTGEKKTVHFNGVE